jgi:DNA-directed RNA polymerase subunit L
MTYISNFKNNGEVVSFDLNNQSNNINISFANAIRRIIISNIETYSIDENLINFFNNTSILNNEFLKHRLTLIPIISDLDIEYDNITISCKKKNENENMESIYVSDFVCTNIAKNEVIDNSIIFKYPSILFGKLKNNQEIAFEAKLVKNNSERGGAQFTPVSTCIYTFKIDEGESKSIMKDMSEEDKRSFKLQDIERVYEKNKSGNPTIYQFSIESIGFYDPKEILMKGFELLIDKLNNLKIEFTNSKSKKITQIILQENPDFFTFLIDDENDTIGNLLSSYIAYNENVFYCGYMIEHPLKKNITLKIKLNNNNTLENVISLICENIDYINTLLNTIMNEIKKA